MTFPPADYAKRGGVGTVQKAGLVAAARSMDHPKSTDVDDMMALSASAREPLSSIEKVAA